MTQGGRGPEEVYEHPTEEFVAGFIGSSNLATYRASAEDRWEPRQRVKIGWHPEYCLVLR